MNREQDDIESAAGAAASSELADLIMPMLAGKGADVQGAAIGQLLAIFVAGHHPMLRDEALTMVVEMARELVPLQIEEMIEAGMCGPEWRGTQQ